MAAARSSPARGAQDTGNPVLDSLINLYSGAGVFPSSMEMLRQLHAELLKLALQEPNGLRVRGKDGHLVGVAPKPTEAP